MSTSKNKNGGNYIKVKIFQQFILLFKLVKGALKTCILQKLKFKVMTLFKKNLQRLGKMLMLNTDR